MNLCIAGWSRLLGIGVVILILIGGVVWYFNRQVPLPERIATEVTSQKTDSATKRPESDDIKWQRELERSRTAKLYGRFLEKSRLGLDAKVQLMRITSKRDHLVQEYRDNRNSPGKVMPGETLSEFYARESRRYDDEMRQLLGDEYDAFMKQTQQIPIAKQIGNFSDQLSAIGASLDETQQQAIVEAIWKRYAESGVDFFYESGVSKIESNRALLEMVNNRKQAEALARGDLSQVLAADQLARLKIFQGTQLQGLIVQGVKSKKRGN